MVKGQFGVKQRGEKWTTRPYVQGVGHVWGGTWETEEEAVKAALRILDAERRLTRRETVASFADRWVRDYPRPKQSSNEIYDRLARRFATAFPDALLHRIDHRTAREYALEHRADLDVLRAMFSDARREGLVLSNPFSELRIPRGRGRRDIVPITEEELDRLASLALEIHGREFGPVVRSLILVAGFTGARPGELFGLDWTDIDYEGEIIHLRRHFGNGRLTKPKSGVERDVFLAPPAAAALRALPARVPRPTCRLNGGEVVFPGKRGQRITQSALSGFWRPVRAAFEATLEPDRLRKFHDVKGALDFYALRHFCASHLVEQGVEAWVIAKQLGHRDGGRLVQTTYAHPREEIARERLREAFSLVQPITRSNEPAEPPIGSSAQLTVVNGGPA